MPDKPLSDQIILDESHVRHISMRAEGRLELTTPSGPVTPPGMAYVLINDQPPFHFTGRQITIDGLIAVFAGHRIRIDITVLEEAPVESPKRRTIRDLTEPR